MSRAFLPHPPPKPGLGVADRQVAIGVARVVVDLDVRRAVHRLQRHRALLDLREGHRPAKSLDVAVTFRDYLGAIEKVMKEVDTRFAAGGRGAG